MFPIRDDAPRTTTPYITYLLLALNVLVFLFEVSLDGRSRMAFIYQFGVVPARVTLSVTGDGALLAPMLSLFTSMFLHGGWLHLIFNMWALYIFGDNIEDHVGHLRYLLLYLVAGVAGSLAHVLFNANSNVPSVGASGAIAGVMGAYFLLFPSARVLMLVPIIFFVTFIWVPAWLVLGLWFVVEFLRGAATSIATTSQTTGGVAFWAHVGGFVSGVALIKLLPRRARPYRYDYY